MLFGGGGNCMRKEEEHVRGTSWRNGYTFAVGLLRRKGKVLDNTV